MTDMTRRGVLGLGAATVLTGILAGRISVQAAETNTLTIAFNSNLPSFDGTVGLSGVNRQSRRSIARFTINISARSRIFPSSLGC